MVRLIDLVGVRFLESSIDHRNPSLIPSGITPLAFARQIANVNFGMTEEGLFPAPLLCDASDADLLAHEAKTDRALVCFRSDMISDEHDLISFFLALGFDLTSDERRLAKSAPYFTRVIEAGALGWLPPCPNNVLEKWRRLRMQQAFLPPTRHANDDAPDWAVRYGWVGNV